MTETEKIETLFEAVQYLAKVWRRVGFPVTFDRSVRVRGVNVRVVIGEEKKVESELGAGAK